MPSNSSTPSQRAVETFLQSSHYSPPSRLQPLADWHWEKIAETKADPKAHAAQKTLRKVYKGIGRSTLEHSIVLLLGNNLLDQPEDLLKSVQKDVLSKTALELLVGKIDTRLLANDARKIDIGFAEYVGGLMVENEYNTLAVARSLCPILGPVVKVAADAYIRSQRGNERDEPEEEPKVPRKPRGTGDQQFLLNVWHAQKNPMPSPPSTPGTDALGGDSDSSMATPSPVGAQSLPYEFDIKERSPAEFFSPIFSPTTFESTSPCDVDDGDLPRPLPDLNKNKLYPPAVLRKLVVQDMDEDELREMQLTVDWSPEPHFMPVDAPIPGLSPRGFMLQFSPGFDLAGNPDAGDSVLREVESRNEGNVPPASGGGTGSSLLGPPFVPLPTKGKGKERENATASSSKLASGSGTSSSILKDTSRSPLTPNNGQSPRGGPAHSTSSRG
ncbi:hypothetical protein DFH06DRAFT_471206 [Mycena polygramma]|nr:hypothetical protein DFH06DRAFT_471206 [Mycena polygramma]